MSLLDIHLQVEPPLHECMEEHLRATTLPRLQAVGTEGPTMVCHHDPPDRRYWEWASRARHAMVSITHTPLLEPWIELHVEAVAAFGLQPSAKPTLDCHDWGMQGVTLVLRVTKKELL